MKNLVLMLLFLISIQLDAQHGDSGYVAETDTIVLEKLEQWQDLKFGLLMHWGPYSQWGIVESWSICSEDEGWCRRSMDEYTQYKAEYEQLPATFNPVDFDPVKWADAAQKAGMKYVVFTTKHHDGFCMFDSKYTDYKITAWNVPFHTNPKANAALEIFQAFREKGLWTGAYFSKPDWNCNDYWWPNFATPDRNVNYDPSVYPDKWESYVQFTHNQIMELMTDYGPMDILWLDGGWVQKLSNEQIQKAYLNSIDKSESGFLKRRYVNQDIRMDELVQKCRTLQPGLIVVDRAVEGKNQNYLTPENQVPDSTLPYPWESCIISGGGWSYTPNAQYMNGREGIHLLVDVVAKGGNLLLNIAPDPLGDWQQGAYDLLAEYASWIAVNGEAIYNTRPVWPYKEDNYGLTRAGDGSIYVIYLSTEEENSLPSVINISSIQPTEKTTVQMLGSDVKIRWKELGNGMTLEIPNKLKTKLPCKHAWVFKINPDPLSGGTN